MGDSKGLKDKAREAEATDSDAGDLGGEGKGLEGPEDVGNIHGEPEGEGGLGDPLEVVAEKLAVPLGSIGYIRWGTGIF